MTSLSSPTALLGQDPYYGMCFLQLEQCALLQTALLMFVTRLQWKEVCGPTANIQNYVNHSCLLPSQ
jgi:hypothetical protein